MDVIQQQRMDGKFWKQILDTLLECALLNDGHCS